MGNLIEKIQSKPDHIKKRIRMIATISIGGFIVLVWATTSYFQYSSSSSVIANSSTEEVTPISSIMSQASKTYAAVANSWAELKKSLMPEGKQLFK